MKIFITFQIFLISLAIFIWYCIIDKIDMAFVADQLILILSSYALFNWVIVDRELDKYAHDKEEESEHLKSDERKSDDEQS